MSFLLIRSTLGFRPPSTIQSASKVVMASCLTFFNQLETENSATVIDNIFSNNIEDEILGGNILITFSEHFSQFTSVSREKIDLKKLNILQRDYSSFSSESFRNDVSIQNWNYSSNNVDDSFRDFYHKLEGCVNRHAPMKKLTPREIKIKNKPWLNEEIAKLIKLRNKAHARKRQPNNVNCKRLYNLLRSRVHRELKKSKKNIIMLTTLQIM